MTALVLRDVACRRGGRLLFKGVSLAIAPGEAAIVIGRNGCGKTSLLRVIAGLLPPFTGDVTFDGDMALLGEASALDGESTLVAALTFWARLDRMPHPAARVERALDEVALSDLSDVPVRLLSTGQRRRAALARVIASGAGLWLLDEPATGLDVASVTLLENAIARHRAAGGAAIVATHQPIEVPGASLLDLADHAVEAA